MFRSENYSPLDVQNLHKALDASYLASFNCLRILNFCVNFPLQHIKSLKGISNDDFEKEAALYIVATTTHRLEFFLRHTERWKEKEI